jgi:hypothetical protein
MIGAFPFFLMSNLFYHRHLCVFLMVNNYLLANTCKAANTTPHTKKF